MKTKKLLNIALISWGALITLLLAGNLYISYYLWIQVDGEDHIAWDLHQEGHKQLGTTCTADKDVVPILKKSGNGKWLDPECRAAEGR